MPTQVPMFEPTSSWRPPKIEDLPKNWNLFEKVGIDVETCDPFLKQLGPSVRRGGYITGYSFAFENGDKWYVPINHQGGDNVDRPDLAVDYLKEQAKHFKGEVVGANLGYDLDYLLEIGVEFKSCRYFRDVQIAEPLIYELHYSYSLENIAKRYGMAGKDEVLLRQAAQDYKIDPKKEMYKLPARYVGPYAAEDALLPLRILAEQEKTIQQNELQSIFNLESKLLPALIRMRRRGVRIDFDKLDFIEQLTIEKENEALKQIKGFSGYDLGLNNCYKATALAEVLDRCSVSYGKTRTGKPNIDKVVLSNIEHPIGAAIKRCRDVNKLRTTFVESVRRYSINGRLHPILNQLKFEDDDGDEGGASYGRMSSRHPNIQQQPSRGEFANLWRSIYIPEEGAIWACNDYSQQEPRWTTHYAEKTKCRGARTMGDAYRNNPKTDNHDMMTTLIHGITRSDTPRDVFEKKRKPCKDIYLGLCYGMGGAKLADSIGMDSRYKISIGYDQNFFAPTMEEAREIANDYGNAKIWKVAGKEAQEVLDSFDEKAPFVKELSKKVQAAAKKKGYIITALGRHCHFPMDENGNYDWTHKALNRLIQGSAGDQGKQAVVEMDAEGFFMHFPVHDETNSSVGTEEEALRAAAIMENCVPMSVPSKVDCEIGPSWGEIK